jgi:hypothetical protein
LGVEVSIMWGTRTIVAVGMLLFSAGCAVGADGDSGDGSEAFALSVTQLAGGCHWECPKCHEGEPCILMPCRIECAPGHTPCGDNVCGPREVCCNSSCGVCVPEGETCTQELCLPGEELCGSNVCGPDEYCCNESCGICAPLDGVCTQQLCRTEAPQPEPPEQCGASVCPVGEECCNPSCGLCAPPGGYCTQQICKP